MSRTENTIIQISTAAGMIKAEARTDLLYADVQVKANWGVASLVECANGRLIVRLYGRDANEVLSSWDFDDCAFVFL